MKTRNLLLAGFVAVAMSACSNSEDFVDNGNQEPLEKNAEMQINFSFPQAAGARAGDKNQGSDLEYGVSKVTAVLVYEGTNKVIITKDLTITEGPSADKVMTATTEAFPVAAGIAKVYAVINKGDVNITEDKYATTLVGENNYTVFLPGKGFNYLTETIAKDKNFLMSGISEKVVITAGTTKTAIISANRVSAKLDEMTSDTPKKLTAPTIVAEDGSTVGVRIIEYAYTNLAENSYVFDTESFESKKPLHKYSDKNTDYTFISNNTNNPTYCLENIINYEPDNALWHKDPSTNVLYKGQVCIIKGEGTEAEYEDITDNFYIKAEYLTPDKKTLFKNYASLQAKYGNLPANEGDLTAEIMKNNGLVQYKGGKCYYGSVIKHTAANGKVTTDIVRNNWYKLSVNTIKDLGYPTPVPPAKEDDAMLELKVLIQPWTFQINNIDL